MAFTGVVVLLGIVFVVVMLAVRGQVRDTVTGNLQATERLFAAVETRRQLELAAQVATLAENPTLKAALDTYHAESGHAEVRDQLLKTIDVELEKVAARVEADAIVLVDLRQNSIAAAGRLSDR